MKLDSKYLQKQAAQFREVSGTSKIEQTLRKAVKILSDQGIPSLVVGGLAVQEHGYARFTKDGDLIVPSVAQAETQLLAGGFQKTKIPGTVVDNGVEIDLLQAGDRLNNSKVPFPQPTSLSEIPEFCGLRTLIELKLSSYLTLPFQRMQDRADVAKLIQANAATREFLSGSVVERAYQILWDGLHKEKE
jgi:hypothetical protein